MINKKLFFLATFLLLTLATNVAPLAKTNFIGLRGKLKTPKGSALLLKPGCEVGVACPVVKENDLLS